MEHNDNLKNILEEIKNLEEKLSKEFQEKRKEFQYEIKHGKIFFTKEVHEKQRQLKNHLLNYLANAKFLSYLVAPIIYALIFPFAILDLFVTVYQLINFPIYNIEKVERRNYIILDRHKLAYLNSIEKFNCLYCSYINGLIGYVREIASRTEQYFCPIRHARKQLGRHSRYHLFTNYGDAEAYKEKLYKIRYSLRNLNDPKDN